MGAWLLIINAVQNLDGGPARQTAIIVKGH